MPRRYLERLIQKRIATSFPELAIRELGRDDRGAIGIAIPPVHAELQGLEIWIGTERIDLWFPEGLQQNIDYVPEWWGQATGRSRKRRIVAKTMQMLRRILNDACIMGVVTMKGSLSGAYMVERSLSVDRQALEAMRSAHGPDAEFYEFCWSGPYWRSHGQAAAA